jgi:anaerobic selenocysteine-containing dehydrogenase
MLENHWYDEDFVRHWTNAPLLVRLDTGRLLRAGDHYVAIDADTGEPAPYDPRMGSYDVDVSRLAMEGSHEVPTGEGATVTCQPVFELLRRGCATLEPSVAEGVTGVPAETITRTARLLWESRPVAFAASSSRATRPRPNAPSASSTPSSGRSTHPVAT